MGLVLVGTFPVSALNIGLAAAIPGFTSQIAKLNADITGLTNALAAQVQVNLAPPELTGLGAALTGLLGSISTSLTNIVTGGVTVNTDLLAQLAFIELQLGVMAPLIASFQAGLNAPGLALWSYSGPSVGFGEALSLQTVGGYGATGATQEINGLVIATESLDSWKSFGQGFNVGTSASAVATSARLLKFIGTLGGGQVNTGVLSVSKQLSLFLAELQAGANNLQASINATLGINLPDPNALIPSIQAAIAAPDVLLGGFAVKTNITAAIAALTAQVDLITSFIAGLTAQLTAGGLSFWSYAGPAGGFGSSLQAALRAGLPNGSGPAALSYGIALAAAVPTAWSAFGQIFKVG